MTAGGDRLTVVVVALLGGAALERCRAGFAGQDCELVTAATGGGATIPGLRLAALRAAATGLVGFIEDTAVPGPDWCAAVRAGLANAAAAGGPVIVAPGLPPRYRALGLSEYGRFRPGAEPSGALPGVNFAVQRGTALALAGEDGLIEGDLAARLLAGGHRIAWLPGMVATYAAPHAEGAALATRFRHGRLYAARRVAGRTPVGRAAYAAAALALPMLLSYRAAAARPPALRSSLATLGWIAALGTAWAAGELAGYASGSAGRGLASWR